MKIMKQLIAILMAISMLCSLAACGGDDPAAGETEAGTETTVPASPSETEIPADTEEIPEEAQDIVLVQDGKPCFTIVCSDNEYTDAAKALANGLKEKTGVTFQSLRFPPEDGTSQIFVGSDYNKLVTDGDRLTDGGYAVIEQEGKLYVCGYQAQPLRTAVQNLLGQLVPKEHVAVGEDGKTISAVLPHTALMFFNPDYLVADPTLLSAHLSEYRIVVPADAGTMAIRAGKMIADGLAYYTGYKLAVVTDAMAPAEREIVVGQTNRKALASLADNAWSITGEGKCVYMNFGSMYAFDGIYAKLRDMFADKETVNLSGTTESYAKSTEDIRILSYNVWTSTPDGFSLQDKYDALYDLIYTLRPDFIGFQETKNWNAVISREIAEDYGVFSAIAVGNLPLFYDKNVWKPATDSTDAVIQKAENFELKNDYVGCWGYHWVMFEGVEGSPREGETVIFGNLHFCNTNEDPSSPYRSYRKAQMDEFNAELKRLETEYAGIPMFFTGDYNTTTYKASTPEWEDGWQDIVGGTQMESGMLLVGDNRSAPWVDHVCVNKNATEVIRWHHLTTKLIYDVSDHQPVFVDVRAKSEQTT